MIRAVLVDDEPPARARLRALLLEAGDVLVVGEAGHADEARAVIAATRPDVIFLDVEMPETRGTTFAASLPAPRPFVVFATAYDRFALEAFSLDAADYLVKPVTRPRLAGTLDRVRARLADASDHTREIAAGSTVQAALFPKVLPPISGFDSAALTVPARGVGGDFYDAFTLGDGRAAFVLGDVAGKGVPAGLLASSLHARIQTGARHAAGQPSALIAAVNGDACASSDGARFATLIYAALDPATGELQVVNAGHPPLLILRADGRGVDTVPATGPAIGLLPDARFDDRRVRMSAGDVLLMVSDGVLESFDEAGEEFGETRLIAVARAHPSGTAADLAARIVAAAHQHRGTAPIHDDMTVLVIR